MYFLSIETENIEKKKAYWTGKGWSFFRIKAKEYRSHPDAERAATRIIKSQNLTQPIIDFD